MAITVSLDEIELTDSVSQMVSSLNSNSTAITNGFSSVPTYSQISRGSSAGLAPGLPSGSGTSKYLREDGTWQSPPNTTYSAGTGLALNGTAFSLGTSGASAGSYGMSSATTGNNGTTVNIPYITVDSYGRVTAISNKVLTCVNSTYGSATTSAAGIVQLNTATNSTSTTQAATPSAVKAAYDLANGKVSCTAANVKSALGTSSGGTKYLRQDGTWQTPPDTNTTYTAGNGLTLSGTEFKMSGSYSGNFTATKVYNAVWNDIAECREAEVTEGGYCVVDGKVMTKSTKRLMAGCRLTSDTFGYCMGETEKAKTPIAIAGRVLVYPYNKKKLKVGDAVCSAPDGTVDVMSRREIRRFPDRIVGIVSEIPDYEVWEAGSKDDPHPVKVDGRVWVYVR